jgi:hypothetical protein
VRWIRRVVVLLALVALAGCRVDSSVEVDVADNGSGTVTVKVSLDDAALARVGDLAGQLRTQDVTAAGWTVSGPSKLGDGRTWITASKPFASPEQLTSVLVEVAGPDGVLRDVTLVRSSGFARRSWDLTATIDLSKGANAFSDGEVAALLGGLPLGRDQARLDADAGGPVAAATSFAFVVGLPGSLDAPDADQVEDGRVTWTASLGGAPQSIAAKGTVVDDAARRWAAIAVALVVLAVASALWASVRVRRRGDRDAFSPGEVDDTDSAWAAALGSDEGDGDEWGAEPEPAWARSLDGPSADSTRAAPTVPQPEPAEPVTEAVGAAADEPAARSKVALVVLHGNGVVFSHRDEVTEVLMPFVASRGGEHDLAMVRATYDDANRGRIDTGELWRVLGVDGDVDELDDAYVTTYEVNADLDVFLAAMARRSTPVACLIDGVVDWCALAHHRHGLVESIDPWLISGGIGTALPDEAAIVAMERATGVEATRWLFVSADASSVTTARRRGASVALRSGDDAAPTPGRRIDSLRDLLRRRAASSS